MEQVKASYFAGRSAGFAKRGYHRDVMTALQCNSCLVYNNVLCEHLLFGTQVSLNCIPV